MFPGVTELARDAYEASNGSTRPGPGPLSAAEGAPAAVTAEQAGAAFATLVACLRGGPFTAGVSALEHGLALDESGRRPELWAAGDEPFRFLRSSAMSVMDLLSRSSRHLRARYETQYGPTGIPLHAFTAGHAAHVRVYNIADIVPAVATA
jgi:hypothetical protein